MQHKKRTSKRAADMAHTAIDLFCGAGGLSAGLEMAGFSVLAGNDMFDAAGVPAGARADYFAAFHQYIYGVAQ